MAKTILCIVEEDVTLNYLFIREMYEKGDNILLVVQQQYTYLVKRYKSLFNSIDINTITLVKDGDEDLWDVLCRTIRAGVSDGVSYTVNLSSGTRLMSIAVQQVLEKFDSKFYFMPLDRNAIIHSQIDDNNDNNDDIVSEIKHTLGIDEYLRINGISCSRKELSQPKEYTEHFFDMFTNNRFSSGDYDILERLRKLRDRHISIANECGLREFLNYICFTPASADKLSPIEIQYLTGNWFEEYIYHIIKQSINPADIAVGVDIQREKSQDHNDLDVVFTYKNRLFAIECKTGVGKASLYHQIVYKACALKEALLGVRSNAYIFSLNEDHKDRLKQTARNMGITFCDREFAKRPNLLKNLFQNSKMWL